jgi:hypothetical protein
MFCSYAPFSFWSIPYLNVIYSVIKKYGLSHQFEQICAQIGDSNAKYSSSLEVECWNEDETHAAQQSSTQF